MIQALNWPSHFRPLTTDHRREIAMDGPATGVPQNRSPLSTILFFCLILYLTTRPNDDPFAQNALRKSARSPRCCRTGAQSGLFLVESIQAAKHVYGNYSAWLNGTQSNYTEVG